MSEPTFHVAVFCKAPVAGSVKTRLIPAYGAQGAAEIYLQLAERTLSTVSQTHTLANCSASLWVADDPHHKTITRWSHDFQMPVHQQHGDNLGARMLQCLQAMRRTHERVLLIGTDCPGFTSQHFIDAANALTTTCPWIFVPSEDGGYVLVGSNAPNDAPFVDIEWSTPIVMRQTRTALITSNQKWAELPSLWDVDEPQDVLHLRRDTPL